MRLAPVPRLAGAVFLLTALLVAGCSRPVGTLAGKVSHKGKALKGGSVSFVSTEGLPSYAAGIKEDGTYSIPEIRGGHYKVCVETSSIKPAAQASGAGGAQAPVIPKGMKSAPPAGANIPEGYHASDPAAMALASNAKKYMPIPPKYADVGTTDLEYTFKGGTETHDIELP